MTTGLDVTDICGEQLAQSKPFSQRVISPEITEAVEQATRTLTDAVDNILGKPNAEQLLKPQALKEGIKLL